MLALQVAAGIVLAYAIIVNQKKLLRWGGQLVSMLALLLGFGAIVWAVVAGVQFVGASIPPGAMSKMLTMVGVIPVFILAMTGGLGLVMLFGLLFRRSPESVARAVQKVADGGDTASERKKDGDKGCLAVFFGLGLLVLVVNYALSFPVWAFTPIGTWYDSLYAYGMTTAWKDGLSILFGAVLWQWPWIPLGIYFALKKARLAKTRPTQTDR